MRVSLLSPESRLSLLFSRARGEVGDLDDRCIDCGAHHPLHLSRQGREVRCHRCAARLAGKPSTQIHHFGGRFDREHTIEIDVNDHAVLTALQDCWWRGRYEPGSPYALGFDIGAWLVVCGVEK